MESTNARRPVTFDVSHYDLDVVCERLRSVGLSDMADQIEAQTAEVSS